MYSIHACIHSKAEKVTILISAMQEQSKSDNKTLFVDKLIYCYITKEIKMLLKLIT